MGPTAKQIYDSALHLSDSERSELAAWLIESLDPQIDEQIDEAWSGEIKRRIDELDSGAVTAVPWPEARRMILGASDGPSSD